jgi:hypothetical protein
MAGLLGALGACSTPDEPRQRRGPDARPAGRDAGVRPDAAARRDAGPTPDAALHPDAATPAEGADLVADVRAMYDALFCRQAAPDELCRTLQKAIDEYRKRYLAPMRRWLEDKRPAGLPSTLLYPFSGGDLLTALTAFPDLERSVQLSLEHGGPPVSLAGLPAGRVAAARQQFQSLVHLLLRHGESFSVDLMKHEAAPLPGVLPLLLVALAVHEAEPTGLRYLQVAADGTVRPYSRSELSADAPRAKRLFGSWHDPRYAEHFSHLELRYRLKGETRERVVRHFAANLANTGLARTPGIAKLLDGLGPVTVMIKAASYLLWGSDFSVVRDLIFKDARFLLSDVTAPYPRYLEGKGFTLEPYGRFTCIGKPRLDAASGPWKAAFRRSRSATLPFRFGYLDCASHLYLVIGRRNPLPG